MFQTVNRFRWLLLMGGLIFWLLPNAARSETDSTPMLECATEVAKSVQRYYQDLRNLQAHFEQQTKAVSMGLGGASQAMTMQGQVAFAKPGKMRWSYEKPEPSVVVSNGESLWIYDPVGQEAQHLPVDAGFLSGAAIQFLFGQGDLLLEFDIHALGCGELAHLKLIPKKDASYERLELWAKRETGAIENSLIVDLLGNETLVRFEKVQLNAELAGDLFDFVPPKGTEVIELTP